MQAKVSKKFEFNALYKKQSNNKNLKIKYKTFIKFILSKYLFFKNRTH